MIAQSIRYSPRNRLRTVVAAWAALFLGVAQSEAGFFTDTIDATPPPTEPVELPVNAASISTAFISASLSRAAIESRLNQFAPSHEEGSRGNPVPDPVVDDALTWAFDRSPVALSFADGRILASTAISGFVRIKGNVRIIRGAIGKLLGKLNPTNVPFSAHADLRADAVATASPQLLGNWRLVPNFDLQINVTQAEIPIVHVGTISVRGQVREGIEGKRTELVNRLNEQVAADSFLEVAAKKEWEKVCKAHRLGDLEPPVWLVVEPQAISASQPQFSAEEMRIGLGVKARTGILVQTQEPSPDCPDFPASLDIVDPMESGLAEIALPMKIDWQAFNELLEKEVAGKTFETSGKTAHLKIVKMEGKPSGRRILLSADVEAAASGWFGASAEGTIWLWAEPQLDERTQKLRLVNVSIDQGSSEVVGKIALSVVSLASEFIESQIMEKAQFDIAAEAEKLKDRAKFAIASLNGSLAGKAEVAAEVQSLTLDRVSVTNEGLEILATAKGSLSTTILTLDFAK